MNSTKKLATTYAKSLFQALKLKKRIDKTNIFSIAKQLTLLRLSILSTELKSIFFNPTYIEEKKEQILLKMYPTLLPTMQSFIKILKEKGHLSLLPEISEVYDELLMEFKNSVPIKIITASPLPVTSGQELYRVLKKLTSSPTPFLTISYNPKLLGGLIFEYKSVCIDTSVFKEFSLFFS